MAIVLIIMGLLIGFSASMIRPVFERAKRSETQGTLKAGIESLAGFAASNNYRLPDAGRFSGIINRLTDSWRKPFYYIYDANLDINNLNADICGYKSTHITVRRCEDSACSVYTDVPDVAYMILSSGANRNNQTSGSLAATTTVTINLYNPGLNVDNYSGDTTRVEAYDDMVEWVTLNELRAKLSCKATPLQIVNNETPYGKVGTPYDIRIYADRGVPFTTPGNYKWCIKGTLPPGVSVTPATPSCLSTTDCISLGTESASQWSQADELQISGIPTTTGSYFFTVLVRDNNDNNSSTAADNCAQSRFVITINP